MDTTSIVYRYAIGRYGDEATIKKAADRQGVSIEDFCVKLYRQSTGVGEYRNPEDLTPRELVNYTPPIEQKRNESISDYRLRQLDYWLKNTEVVENKLGWKKKNKTV